jgi:FkbM family methyltransferase
MKSPKLIAASAVRWLLLPIAPARRKLGLQCFIVRLTTEMEPEMKYLDEFIAGTRTAVDIGANVGTYTYRLSKRFQRVVAFEINERITEAIRQYRPSNVELIHCGLSSHAGRAQFYVPVSGGVELAGWASLSRENFPGAEQVVAYETELKPLDEFALADVDFMKIDVEGHEVEVLKGAAETIARSRPMVLVELKKEHVQEVNEWFLNFDYKHCRLEDFIDVPGSRSNHIYTPMERLAQFGIARPVD